MVLPVSSKASVSTFDSFAFSFISSHHALKDLGTVASIGTGIGIHGLLGNTSVGLLGASVNARTRVCRSARDHSLASAAGNGHNCAGGRLKHERRKLL